MSPSSEAPAVHLPTSAFTTLSHRCAGLGEAGIEALREAGYRAGAEVLATLGDAPSEILSEEFWVTLGAAFTRAGLGTVAFEPVSPVLGSVQWLGSVEAAGSQSGGKAESCHFAAGLLAGVLSRTAGRTVDVIEARCSGGSSQPCWFLFGSVETLRGIRPRLGEIRDSIERMPPETVGR